MTLASLRNIGIIVWSPKTSRYHHNKRRGRAMWEEEGKANRTNTIINRLTDFFLKFVVMTWVMLLWKCQRDADGWEPRREAVDRLLCEPLEDSLRLLVHRRCLLSVNIFNHVGFHSCVRLNFGFRASFENTSTSIGARTSQAWKRIGAASCVRTVWALAQY